MAIGLMVLILIIISIFLDLSLGATIDVGLIVGLTFLGTSPFFINLSNKKEFPL